jgi:hypothetical protein
MNAARLYPALNVSVRGLLQVLIMLVAVSATAAAEQVILDFEEVRKPLYPPKGAGGDLYTVIRRPIVAEEGFKLKRPKAGARTPSFAYWDPAAPEYTGSVALQAQRPFSESTILRRAGRGRTFSLVQFDATNCCSRKQTQLTVRAVKANGRVIKREIRVPNRPNLRTFRFTPIWSDLQTVSFRQTDFTQLDNIVLEIDDDGPASVALPPQSARPEQRPLRDPSR